MTPYVVGDGAIDALLGVARAETIEIVISTPIPPGELRRMFAIPDEVPIHVTDEAPEPTVLIDRLALLPDGSLIDRTIGERWSGSTEVRVLSPELSVPDIVRLYVWRRRYPELGFPLSLIRRLNADIAHFSALSAEQPDVAIHLLAADLDTLVITS